jgi:hypothetical protein
MNKGLLNSQPFIYVRDGSEGKPRWLSDYHKLPHKICKIGKIAKPFFPGQYIENGKLIRCVLLHESWRKPQFITSFCICILYTQKSNSELTQS